MIRAVKTETGIGAQFFCDHCNLPIDQIGLAMYLWKERWTTQGHVEVLPRRHPSVLVEDGQIYILHKRCANDFEAQHGGKQYNWPWAELVDLLLFLTHNGGLTLENLKTRLETRLNLSESMSYDDEEP